MLPRDIENSFTYHAPTPEQVELYRQLRDQGKQLALLINKLCPNSPEATIAIRRVEEAIMWANKAIACNSDQPKHNFDRLSNKV